MQFVVHFLHVLGRLPLPVLYWISGLVAWLLRKVIGYRKDVILSNLRHSFPDKNEEAIHAIMKQYYQHLADTMVETARLSWMSPAELKNRVEFEEPDLLRSYAENGKNVILLMGHSGNWEWANAVTASSYDLRVLPIYRKVKDPYMNQYFIDVRSRFGSHPILDKTAFQDIRKEASPHAVAILGDHTPGPKKALWVDFLHQNTPFYRGTEVLMRRLDYALVFAHVRKVDRGHYSIHFEEYHAERESSDFDVTRQFVAFLEREVKAQPFNWLWSHRRWKHKMPEGATRVER